MNVPYNILLFIITLLAGSLPLWGRRFENERMNYLLAFSGSFLLSITFLHLLPESFSLTHHLTGAYLLAGFFIQLLIQRLTHGLEHGHVQKSEHHIAILPILAGLVLHAFMEGLPLGFKYEQTSTTFTLYLAVAVHKLPEAIIATTLVLHVWSKREALIFLLLFSLITPAGSILAASLSSMIGDISKMVTVLLPVVAGAFIHISTTIFFESGTKQHILSFQKIIAILSGLAIGLVTLFF